MHQISLTAFFNVLSILCVCVVVHVYMRGTELHIFGVFLITSNLSMQLSNLFHGKAKCES